MQRLVIFGLPKLGERKVNPASPKFTSHLGIFANIRKR